MENSQSAIRGITGQLQQLEERREELLKIIPNSNDESALKDTEKCTDLIQEWLQLVSERDRLLRDLFKQENKATKDKCLTDILQLLTSVGEMDHTDTPESLKKALCVLYGELQQYCAENNNLCQEEEPDGICATVAPVPPTPPPLPVFGNDCETSDSQISSPQVDGSDSDIEPPSCKKVRVEQTTPLVARKIPKNYHLNTPNNASAPASSSRSTNLRRYSTRLMKKTIPKTPQTPVFVIEDDLKNSILLGKDSLRSTPDIERSPGGTPVRLQPQYDPKNPSDLVARALQNKFQKIRTLYSPSYNQNESMDEAEHSLCISID